MTARSTSLLALALISASGLAACGDSTGVGEPANVSLNFRVGSAPSLAAIRAEPTSDEARANTSHQLEVSGSNGMLAIDGIWLIVAEAELDGDDDMCTDSDGDDSSSGSDSETSSECAEFEAPPRFLQLPLDGSPVPAFEGLVPPGTYTELEFEIEDLEDDEDGELAAEIAELRGQILEVFDDWPPEASALIEGTFTPTGEAPRTFRVYVEAEVEIERTLSPPITVVDGEGGTVDLTVDIRVDAWFSSSDDTVLDLSMYDYDDTGEVLPFELEMEDGFTEIEVDDDF